MNLLAGAVLVASSAAFICLTVVVFAKPALVERFFACFASSARTHFVEQTLRVLFGGSLVIYSTAMWQSLIFRIIGWAIVTSSVALMLIPWQWHHRLGKKLWPGLIRHLRLYAIGSFVFGAVILYAVFAPQFRGA